METLAKDLKRCRTANDVFRAVNIFLNNNNIRDKYSIVLQRSLAKQNDFNKALQTAWNYILNHDFPTKSNDMKVVRWKGTAIGGMECHSPGH